MSEILLHFMEKGNKDDKTLNSTFLSEDGKT